MKFSTLALLCLISTPTKIWGATDEECTHGKLYVSDDSTADLNVIDVSGGNLQDLTVETKVSLPAEGAGQLVFYGPSDDPLVVQYRGKEEEFYAGSFVRVIDTGLRYESHGDHDHIEYRAPAVVENANIDDCVRPIHVVHHDEKIAIFCDGSFDAVPQKNATVHVIDTTKLGSATESAIVQKVTLEGAHHGVAIPVDDGHLLHSLALPERVNGDPEASSLPSTFQVVDFEGDVLHEIADTTNPNTHCAGFHGSASMGNTFVLGCDDVHGGIVIVDFNPTQGSYTSRALLYPEGESFEGFRIGSFAYHKEATHVVGAYSLSGGSEFYLMAFPPSSTALTTKNLLRLPGNAAQCSYQFEVGSGEHLLVFMPNGFLHIFEISNDSFTEVMTKEIVPGMTACSEAAFTAGIGQAFVATPADRSIYAIDLQHVEEGEIEVYKSAMPFTPTGVFVSGFTEGTACRMDHDHEGHDHGDKSASGKTSLSVSGVLALAACGLFFA